MLGSSSTSSKVRSRLRVSRWAGSVILLASCCTSALASTGGDSTGPCMRSQPLAISSVSWPVVSTPSAITFICRLCAMLMMARVSETSPVAAVTSGTHERCTLITSTGRVRSRPRLVEPAPKSPSEISSPSPRSWFKVCTSSGDALNSACSLISMPSACA